MDVAGETIKFGDDEGGAMQPAESEMFLIQIVRWPLSFFTSARNFPSAESVTFSMVPILVISLTETVAKG